MGSFDQTNDPQRPRYPQQYGSTVPLRHGSRNQNIREVDIEDRDPTETTKLLLDCESRESSSQSLGEEDNDEDRLSKVNGDQGTSTDIERTGRDTDCDTDAHSRYKDVRAAVSEEDNHEMACVSLRLNFKLI